jgi:hypothetical protein
MRRRAEITPGRERAFLYGVAVRLTANAQRRGKFVRERLLCAPPPPPPPNVAVNPPVVNPRLSTRQRFEEHTAHPACVGCHELMDPIGFGFEEFDATGVFREVDGGLAVDASGELIDTDVDGSFVGVRELSQRLLESQQVRRLTELRSGSTHQGHRMVDGATP